jgi:propionyl-CoA carboxylase alpha chain
VRYRPPQEGRFEGVTVRNDTGVYEGGEISIYYDPMIAKLVTHAGDRLTAIDAQARALDAFYIDGIRHNIPFLSTLMQHPRWREGRLSTGFIAEEFPDGFSARAPEGETERVMAAIAAHVDHCYNKRKRRISGQLRAPESFDYDVKRVVKLGAALIPVEVVHRELGIDVIFQDGRRMRVDTPWTPGQPVWRGDIDEKPVAAQIRPILNGFEIEHAGAQARARVLTVREAELDGLMIERKGADTSKFLLCPMPGLVKSIAVKEGQEVKAGEALCMVEAMKMENVLLAERDVTVAKILASPGDSLAVDAVIMEFA